MKIKYYNITEIKSIQDMLIKSAAEFDRSPALCDLNRTPISKVSYRELLTYVLRFGSALFNLGLKERSHIAVIGENRVQWGITYLTSMCFNMVIIPIDKNLSSNEIINILHESDAEAVIFSESFEQLFRYETPALKKLKCFISMDLPSLQEGCHSFTELVNESAPYNISNLPVINPDDPAEIIFTSGSLGRAKGVMLSQKNLASNLMAMRKMVNISEKDIFLSVLPMHHTYECTCGFLCPIYSGSSVYYARSLKTVADDLQKVHATILLGVPLLFEKMYKRIYKTINENKRKALLIKPIINITNAVQKLGFTGVKKSIFRELHDKMGGSVRLFIAGGAAPNPEVAKGLREFGFMFLQGYGLTETSPILTLNQIENFKDNAAGFVLPGIEIKINTPDADGIGEIFAKGESIMPGYYKNQKLTEEAFEDGWFKTGDLGKFDADGFLHICGRKKNVIIANNGKNVFPEEIEDLLNRHPLILESFVFGEKDAKHDEIIAAQVVVDSESIIEYSERNTLQIDDKLLHTLISQAVKEVNMELTGYKQIKKFYIREKEFEKTTTQKIKRYLIDKEGVVTAEQ